MDKISQRIYVYADWPELRHPTLMGFLHARFIRGKEIFSFEFSSGWLKSKSALIIDPDLQLYPGRQYIGDGKISFGIFLDSSPDRWGRQLMRRREAIRARNDNRPVRQMSEADYLLGVHDTTRMGALRFKLDESGDFLNNDSELPAPPWATLRELEAACRYYEQGRTIDGEHEKWLNMLLAPGSSLGGARPKANVMDNNGDLWIAKFPSCADHADIGAWEMLVHKLARRAGLRVSECRIERRSRYGTIFLTRRFDRSGRKRVHFASAMTLLGKKDGDDCNSGCSYLDLAQFIVQYGASPSEDLIELWRRIVFSIAVSNTDDHLRNHGFLLTPRGWTLSSAYDLNPNPQGTGLSLNISMDDNSLDFDLALSVAEYFRLNTTQAKEQLAKIDSIVGKWREIAYELKIPSREIADMAPAFQHRDS